MLTSYTYRLLEGSSWGIVIGLQGEVMPGARIPPSAVKVADGLWLQVDVAWTVSEEQVGHLQRGLLLVACDIERTAGGVRPILVRVTGLQYNPTDYQPEGLVAAVAEWAAQACGFAKPHIPATFDRSRRRYVFTFARDAVDEPQTQEFRTRIDITAPPSTWLAESALAVLRHFWVDALFQPMGSAERKPLRDVQVVLRGSTASDFLIIPHPGEQRGRDEPSAPASRNRILRFLVGGNTSSGTGPQHLVLLCEERTEEIERLQRSLEKTLWANEMATQEMSNVA